MTRAMCALVGAWLVVLAALIIIVPAHAAAALTGPAAIVTDAMVGRSGHVTRIALDLSDRVAFNVFTLSDPHRVVIDLADVHWQAPRVADGAGGAGGPCGRLRHGEVRPGTWRVVLECAGTTTIREALLQTPSDGSGYRLIVELAAGPRKGVLGYMTTDAPRKEARAPAPVRSAAAPPAEAATPRSLIGETKMAALTPPPPAMNRTLPPEAPAALATAPSAPATARRAPAPPPVAAEIGAAALTIPLPPRRPQAPRAQRVVVLDAGHGGADPGAVGVSGIYEKDITLAAVREIKRALNQTGDYKVLLTRNDDRFIRLRDRVDFARRAGADLFVSVHADSVGSRDVRGASVYTLSKTASDSEAAALADKENKADLIAGLDLSRESEEVTNILIDLAQRETMNRSAALAGHVVERLAGATGVLPNPHRFAGFAVLKAPDIPSVLIELGFLSNRSDEQALRRSDHRARVASAVAGAIDGYLTETLSASAW